METHSAFWAVIRDKRPESCMVDISMGLRKLHEWLAESLGSEIFENRVRC